MRSSSSGPKATPNLGARAGPTAKVSPARVVRAALDRSQGGRVVVVVVELVVVVVVDVVSQTWAAVHISSSGQVPQFSGARVRQVPSGIMPQWAPAASHVVGVQQAPGGLLPGGLL